MVLQKRILPWTWFAHVIGESKILLVGQECNASVMPPQQWRLKPNFHGYVRVVTPVNKRGCTWFANLRTRDYRISMKLPNVRKVYNRDKWSAKFLPLKCCRPGEKSFKSHNRLQELFYTYMPYSRLTNVSVGNIKNTSEHATLSAYNSKHFG